MVEKLSPERVIEAIKGSGGIKVVIAQRLGVHRNSVDNYLKRYASVRRAYDDETQGIGDLVESIIIKDIQAGGIETAKWFARFKLKDRGYVERQEVTGAEGGEIIIKVVYDKDA